MSAMLAACSSDDNVPATDQRADTGGQNDSGAIAFDARMGSGYAPSTRTPSPLSTLDALKEAGVGFGVFACYTGTHKYYDVNVSPDFMYNDHVTFGSSNWEYTPVKYWPNGEGEVSGNTGQIKHYVSFFAYAPWSDNVGSTPNTNPAGYCITSFSNQGDQGDTWLTYRLIPQENLDKQVDLLCARPLLDQSKQAVNERLHFVFDHALACVGDTVSISVDEDFIALLTARVDRVAVTAMKVVVTKITIDYTLTEKGRLLLWKGAENADANWQVIFSGTPTTRRTVTYEDINKCVWKNGSVTPEEEEKTQWINKGIYYIPAEFDGYPQTAQVSITYKIESYQPASRKWVTEETVDGTATITLNKYPNAYKSGKHLNLGIKLNDTSVVLDGIEVVVDTEKYTDQW
jgi:hypothetical protein